MLNDCCHYLCISLSFYWKLNYWNFTTFKTLQKRFLGKDVVGRIKSNTGTRIAHAYARLKAEITIMNVMLARGPVCKKKRGKRIEEPGTLTRPDFT